MDISKIKVRFGGKYEPKDERLIGLLKNAYQGKLLVHTVLIKFEGIKAIDLDLIKVSSRAKISNPTAPLVS